MRQRSNSEDFLERESSMSRDKPSSSPSSRLSSHRQSSSTPRQSLAADEDHHEGETPSSPPVVLAGSYRKGTMNAMATSRAQDAMIRHQVAPVLFPHLYLTHLFICDRCLLLLLLLLFALGENEKEA
jgi:hypothetical protein